MDFTKLQVMKMSNQDWDIETLAIRAGQVRTQEGEHSDPIFMTSSYVFASAAEAEARFLSEPTAEGDLIVTFKEPVFQRFNRDELNELSRWVENAAPALLTPAEALQAGDGWSPGRNARFGLLARRRLLEDAAEAKPVRIIRAKNAAVATN